MSEFHSHQMTDVEAIKAFVYGGNATFTLVSKKTSARFTFRVRRAEAKGGAPAPHFVSLLTGSDNESSFSYMGMLVKSKEEGDNAVFVRATAKSAIDKKASSFLAINWFLANMASTQVEFWHCGKCARCGRKLTVPASIECGIGPECQKKGGE